MGRGDGDRRAPLSDGGRVIGIDASIVRIPRLRPALARDDDVTAARSHAGVSTGYEIDVTGVTGKAFEPSRQRQSVSFRDTASPADVSTREVVITDSCGLLGEFV